MKIHWNDIIYGKSFSCVFCGVTIVNPFRLSRKKKICVNCYNIYFSSVEELFESAKMGSFFCKIGVTNEKWSYDIDTNGCWSNIIREYENMEVKY